MIAPSTIRSFTQQLLLTQDYSVHCWRFHTTATLFTQDCFIYHSRFHIVATLSYLLAKFDPSSHVHVISDKFSTLSELTSGELTAIPNELPSLARDSSH
ncbi:hypothetical protein RRG08_010330 [Elysia crispata]|uniref:Uncharacterized protein n=1 Tax=Elysia crispata TaxID=231223 RepID=A0AAE0Y757_9GAST|nr:hypothetical protein RRG08_010330 [Elysia crispata]